MRKENWRLCSSGCGVCKNRRKKTARDWKEEEKWKREREMLTFCVPVRARVATFLHRLAYLRK